MHPRVDEAAGCEALFDGAGSPDWRERGAMAGSSSRGIVRLTLAGQVTEAIREMILTGDLAAGQHVTHDELASRLAVSTMPTREALLRLTHEGFIVLRRGRHFEIVPTTPDDIEDVYWAHASMTGELSARACENSDDGFVAALTAVHEEWEATPLENVAKLERLSNEFHKLINRQARSPKLMVFLRNILTLIPERYYTLVPGWHEISARGHRDMLSAIRGGDAEEARRAAESHIREIGTLLAEQFNNNGHWIVPNRDDYMSS